MQKLLFIINSAPYGNESFFSGLRLALQIQEQHKAEINIFLMSDAVVLLNKRHQKAITYSKC